MVLHNFRTSNSTCNFGLTYELVCAGNLIQPCSSVFSVIFILSKVCLCYRGLLSLSLSPSLSTGCGSGIVRRLLFSSLGTLEVRSRLACPAFVFFPNNSFTSPLDISSYSYFCGSPLFANAYSGCASPDSPLPRFSSLVRLSPSSGLEFAHAHFLSSSFLLLFSPTHLLALAHPACLCHHTLR